MTTCKKKGAEAPFDQIDQNYEIDAVTVGVPHGDCDK